MKAPDRSLMIPNAEVTKDMLSEWLTEIPDDAEIGIDVGQFGQLDLLAIREGGDPDMWILALGGISYPAEKPMLDELRTQMAERLRETDQSDKGVMIVTIEGVVSGAPDLFSMSVHEGFKFRDRTHANEFIEEFSDVLRHALILAC